MATYKINSPAVATAWDEQLARIDALRAKAKAFGARFGADEQFVVNNRITYGYQVAGFTFTPRKDTAVWTHPDPKLFGAQRPRLKVSGVTPAQREEWKKLRAEWDESYPGEILSWGSVLEAVGLTAGDLFFSGAFSLFLHDGWAYLKVGVKPRAEHLVEILNSEYDAALAAHEAQNKAQA